MTTPQRIGRRISTEIIWYTLACLYAAASALFAEPPMQFVVWVSESCLKSWPDAWQNLFTTGSPYLVRSSIWHAGQPGIPYLNWESFLLFYVVPTVLILTTHARVLLRFEHAYRSQGQTAKYYSRRLGIAILSGALLGVLNGWTVQLVLAMVILLAG